ncbi:amidohydrolase [Nitzschia inconspicua]|uniref:Amidohydrolase n=1 Tax=Nitzschia inconspicua TaxID=303405 RepID=A0A9K3LE91_9STRA|nr:amidohydrolase [Nitzschia inconspicua]KAG7360799.1 amidohydrolase [Nitzschia inconspicua]
MSETENNKNSKKLPNAFLDAHHHFVDTTSHGDSFQAFLAHLIPDFQYLPSDYKRDVIDPIQKAGVAFLGSVHVECIPDDGIAEAEWIASFTKGNSAPYVKAIVASCNLAQDSDKVEEELSKISTQLPHVKGIRWILDCVGKFNGNDATHIATKRHDGIDYLRGSEGGYEGHVVSAFESGFGLLDKYNMTFDLQCAPVQLQEASKLCRRHPNIKVVIDHLGKPRTLFGADNDKNNNNASMNQGELAVWREGMKSMAQNSNVYVKISMLGYAIPGWISSQEYLNSMKQLVWETVTLFGPKRCMVATNFWKDAATSDADGMSDVGPDPVQFMELVYGFLKDDVSDEDLECIFSKTAASFYGVSI